MPEKPKGWVRDQENLRFCPRRDGCVGVWRCGGVGGAGVREQGPTSHPRWAPIMTYKSHVMVVVPEAFALALRGRKRRG